jgi:hypothetical protein
LKINHAGSLADEEEIVSSSLPLFSGEDGNDFYNFKKSCIFEDMKSDNTPGNPWSKASFIDGEFILEADRKLIFDFNKKSKAKYKFHPECLPEPFVGRYNAPVVLLNLNPKFVNSDTTSQTESPFAKLCRANWVHQNAKYPFYYLHPDLKTHPGSEWWRKKLGEFMDVGSDEHLSRKIFAIEFCAYPSKNSSNLSQLCMAGDKYRNRLVKDAMKRKAIIIIMQGASHWYNALPKLKTYKKTFELKNPQNSHIKGASLCWPIKKFHFEKILKIIES